MNITLIIDLLTGKRIEACYRHYRKSQWYGRVELEAIQARKLRALMEHCYAHIPYYREFMDRNGLTPDSFKSSADIRLLPIMTKEKIKQDYDKFTPSNLQEIKGVKKGQTGGTTGNILFNRNDANVRSHIWGSYKLFSEWMGVGPRARKLILMGGHVMGRNYKDKFRKAVYNIISNSVAFNPYDTSEQNLQAITRALQSNQFELIRGYPQFLYSLARRLKEQGLSFRVRAVTTTAEPLMPEQRKLFADVFQAESFDQYGCGEINGISYECPAHSGMHIMEERVIVEVNEKNQLIVTDLDNFAMPFIRYWNADEALISDEPCPCGRKSRLIKQVMGRTCDYVCGLNGQVLHWAYFWHLFFDSQVARKYDLRKFQVVQEAPDAILIRLVCGKLPEDEERMLVENMRSRLGPVQVRYVYEADIENSASGKYRPVVNNLLVKAGGSSGPGVGTTGTSS